MTLWPICVSGCRPSVLFKTRGGMRRGLIDGVWLPGTQCVLAAGDGGSPHSLSHRLPFAIYQFYKHLVHFAEAE